MDDKKDTNDLKEAGDSTESAEYEDDFEKDLEWLINEEKEDNFGETENEDDIETKTDSNLEDNEEKKECVDADLEESLSNGEKLVSIPNLKPLDHTSDTDSESSVQESKLENRQDLDDEDDEEIKRYILEKIEEANKLLQNQEPLNENRERKLKFKDKLVDLEVPPLEDTETYKNDPESEEDVSSRLSQLHISNEPGLQSMTFSLNGGKDEEQKDGKILVEKDGKFELLSLRDIESHGFFPPISVSFTDIETQSISPKFSHSIIFGTPSLTKEEPLVQPGVNSCFPIGEEFICFPKPPSNPKYRPTSAINTARSMGMGRTPRRVQSAIAPWRNSTYSLSPRQKELQKQMQKRKEKLRKEEEAQKRQQEEEKKRENDMVFRAWLQKKKEQVQEEKRIQRAKELEGSNSRQENRDPEEAFRLWLKKKHQEQMKEKQMEILRRQEECLYFLPRTEERDRAFKQWLKRKREEKRAEELAAKERSRQLRLEARRAKQIQNILCTISEPKSFRFTDHYS
ncbi:coiled-coil domain-containing protein 181 [Pelodiscus sinensis]|uniref:coiled-coil domain-containing protein 181 n=1 Tax=Pelodiscus sinensis TaxID=13735 RepID=UPI0003C45054|nr:coiled-coil domain-containing protein 181 [Pelodiscus sinensis]XP_014433081.1 coiled-coil domain-containing protein 181 [Pelodiscus sinensis]|eukprot:XP_006112275.1 coiled-coil domain-containing protein 181 [Pelodiscus sinensis]